MALTLNAAFFYFLNYLAMKASTVKVTIPPTIKMKIIALMITINFPQEGKERAVKPVKSHVGGSDLPT
jgi:hypothetical protein